MASTHSYSIIWLLASCNGEGHHGKTRPDFGRLRQGSRGASTCQDQAGNVARVGTYPVRRRARGVERRRLRTCRRGEDHSRREAAGQFASPRFLHLFRSVARQRRRSLCGEYVFEAGGEDRRFPRVRDAEDNVPILAGIQRVLWPRPALRNAPRTRGRGARDPTESHRRVGPGSGPQRRPHSGIDCIIMKLRTLSDMG
jgi:hypothetical protein